MYLRTRLTRSSLAPLLGSLVAGSLAATSSAPAAAQVAIAPERAVAEVVANHGRTAAPVASAAVVTNTIDVERLARRWYRSLDGASTLGGGSVVVYARVEADGRVTEAFVPFVGPHHPALNGLARRLVRTMRFAAVEPDGSPIGSAALGAGGYWVAQRIVFRR